jgi:hypothetical protein
MERPMANVSVDARTPSRRKGSGFAPDLAAVILFSLIGLTVSAALVAYSGMVPFGWLPGAF